MAYEAQKKRMTQDEWERARADYEARNVTLSAIADKYRVDKATVSRKAKAQGWIQGKLQPLATEKMAAVRALSEVDVKLQQLSCIERITVEKVAEEQLREAGYLAELGTVLARKGVELARMITTPEEWEVMTRGKRNLAPPQSKTSETTVNVNQAQQAQIKPMSPRDVLADLMAKAREDGYLDDADA